MLHKNWKSLTWLSAGAMVTLALLFATTSKSQPTTDLLEELRQFKVDGVGFLNTTFCCDLSPNTTTGLKGEEIGPGASLTFRITNNLVPGKNGQATITTHDGSHIFMFLSGVGQACFPACPISSGKQDSTAEVFGYVITGGSGKFLRAGGAGSFTWGISDLFTNGSKYWVRIDGNIQTPDAQ